jgi:hypothetical protein
MTLPTSQKLFVHVPAQGAKADPHKPSPSGLSPAKIPAVHGAWWYRPPPVSQSVMRNAKRMLPSYADPATLNLTFDYQVSQGDVIYEAANYM